MPELVDRPLLGFGKVGRAGQSWANAVEQAAGVLHNVGVAQPFVANQADGRSSRSAVG
jgi:hypothetical protein